jgi:hypothetical protein
MAFKARRRETFWCFTAKSLCRGHRVMKIFQSAEAGLDCCPKSGYFFSMETATRYSRFASLALTGLLLCGPLVQPSVAGLFFYPTEVTCCGSCDHAAPASPLAVAEDSAGSDPARSAQTTQSGQRGCDVCPTSLRCSSGAPLLLSHLHGMAPVVGQTAHLAPRTDDPVTPLHDGGLFRPPRSNAA